MVSISPEMKDEKFYKILEPSFTRINNECISMKTDEKSSSVKITLQVLDELIGRMKKASKLFEWLFNRVTYVGSYFDGLRVKEATEFDINIVLKLPLNYEKLKVKRIHVYPGFVVVNLNDSWFTGDKMLKYRNEKLEISKWLDQGGNLSHKCVLKWWESVFSKVQQPTTVVVENEVYRIVAFKKSGPAITAHISGAKFDIDVDLVPVIEFPRTVRPPSPIRWTDQAPKPKTVRPPVANENRSLVKNNSRLVGYRRVVGNKAGMWYIVPKPRDDAEFVWRLSFPEQEKKIMNGLNKLKMVNRFMKRIRDVFNWRPLPSYYIKTIFLWEAQERRNKKDVTFFHKNLGYLFVYFLGKLQIYLEQGNLPFFWDKEMNLLVNVKRVTLDGFARRIKHLRAKLEHLVQSKDTTELTALIESLFHRDEIARSDLSAGL